MNLTHADIRAWEPCWDEERLNGVLARHEIWTPELIAAQADIGPADRLWALFHCCSASTLVGLCLRWGTARVLGWSVGAPPPWLTCFTAAWGAADLIADIATVEDLSDSDCSDFSPACDGVWVARVKTREAQVAEVLELLARQEEETP